MSTDDKRDAARYRALRDASSGEDGDVGCFYCTGYGEGYPDVGGEDLDKAVDNMIRASKDAPRISLNRNARLVGRWMCRSGDALGTGLTIRDAYANWEHGRAMGAHRGGHSE